MNEPVRLQWKDIDGRPTLTHASDPRGFAIYADFKDRYDANVMVKKSSLATEPCVWIFVDGGQTGDNDGAAHLTVEMATVLRDALDSWISEVREESRGDS